MVDEIEFNGSYWVDLRLTVAEFKAVSCAWEMWSMRWPEGQRGNLYYLEPRGQVKAKEPRARLGFPVGRSVPRLLCLLLSYPECLEPPHVGSTLLTTLNSLWLGTQAILHPW